MGQSYPRALLQVVLQEVCDDGALLSCAVNAACLALLNAGVSLRCCAAAITCCLSSQGQFLVDPVLAEEQAAQATFHYTFTMSESGFATSEIMGRHTDAQAIAAYDAGKEGAAVLLAFFRQSMERLLSKDA